MSCTEDVARAEDWWIPSMNVERLASPATDADIRQLSELLVDAVESGAAVSFLSPLSVDRAAEWWRQSIAAMSASAIHLVVRDKVGIVATVQALPAWAPNQPHRAEVVKLLVHRRARRNGVGRRLMRALEVAAQGAGFTLLTLDAKRGAAAELLYQELGWTAAGVIPGYAIDPDGTPHDAVFYYKELSRAEEVIDG